MNQKIYKLFVQSSIILKVVLILPGNSLELAQQQPHLFSVNARFTRNEGATMGEGQKLWRRAKRVIPGGNMLLSKRQEMFLLNGGRRISQGKGL